MKKITWTWKKILVLIGTLLGIGTLVSCYGMPINGEPYFPEDGEYEEPADEAETSDIDYIQED